MKRLLTIFLLLAGHVLQAQVSVNGTGAAPDNSAMLDVSSNNKGMLIPRMIKTERDAIQSPATGLMIYQTDNSPGFYYNAGTTSSPSWIKVGSSDYWGLSGNAGTNPATNFIGTLDGNYLRFRVNNTPSGRIDGVVCTAFGYDALAFTGGYYNTAFGYNALHNTISNENTGIGHQSAESNTSGSYNVSIGAYSLKQNQSSSFNIAIGNYALATQSYNVGNSWAAHNIAIGYEALYLNQPTNPALNGIKNLAIGNYALRNNMTGYRNLAVGYSALNYNISGFNNVALGHNSQTLNINGNFNTSVGVNSLNSNLRGSQNTAVGNQALSSQSYDPGMNFNSDNVAVGVNALYNNQPTSTSNGINNTAVGTYALYYNTYGYSNTATGFSSSFNTTTGFLNTSFGANSMVSNVSGSYNTAIGPYTGPNVGNIDNTTCLGMDATATATDMVRIGNSYVNSIGGQVGWTTLSDGRFKEDVHENVPGLSFITQLRPVTYRIDREAVNVFTGVKARHDEIRRQQPGIELYTGDSYSQVTTGFIAQEVEAAAENLGFSFSGVDAPKNENDMYGLRYADFVVPLVKGMQEQQAQIEELKATNAMLLERLSQLEEELSRR